jgi:hypothetical protein
VHAAHIKLHPGAAAEGTEEMYVTVERATRIAPDWCSFNAALTIEGVPFCTPRPGVIYLREAAIPSCVIHLPVMAGKGNRMFKGWHTLLFRAIYPAPNE